MCWGAGGQGFLQGGNIMDYHLIRGCQQLVAFSHPMQELHRLSNLLNKSYTSYVMYWTGVTLAMSYLERVTLARKSIGQGLHWFSHVLDKSYTY